MNRKMCQVLECLLYYDVDDFFKNFTTVRCLDYNLRQADSWQRKLVTNSAIFGSGSGIGGR